MLDLVLHIVTWGERCNHGLMDRLLPTLIQGEDAKFLGNIDVEISTDDPSKITRSPWYSQLAFFRSLEFFHLDTSIRPVHACVATAEREFVKRSRGRVMLFLPPDMAVARGSLSYCVRKIEEGFSMVVTTGVRCRDDVQIPLGASPRQLTQWCWKHKHRFTDCQTWGNQPHYSHGSCVFFPCEAGYVARCHHLMPVAIKHDGSPIEFTGTVDDDLVAAIPPELTHIITDSDEACFVEISPPERLMRECAGVLTVDEVKDFAQRPRILPIHRYFFRHRIIHRLGEGSTDAQDQSLFPC